MAVYITGDTHSDVRRFSTDSFFEQKEFGENKEENIVIVAGDFGLVFDKEESKYEKHWLKWLEEKQFIVCFTDGNHENFNRLYQYPVKEWRGGKIHEIRSNVFHLMRGEIFEIEGKKFFVNGGAASHDISDGILDIEDTDWNQKARALDKQGKYMYRIKGLTWWEQEMPSKEEMQYAKENLEKHDWKVDYIITHDCAASTQALFSSGKYKPNELNIFLEEIRQKCDFKYWFFGHHHFSKTINDRETGIYEQIVRIL